MKLVFKAADLAYSAEKISEFLLLSKSIDGSSFSGMGETILAIYTELDENELAALSPSSLARHVESRLRDKHRQIWPEVLEKEKSYQTAWDNVGHEIEAAMSDIFGQNLTDKFNGMLAHINMNPICPRYLDERSFDIFYLYSPNGAVDVAMHEITHFIWFEVWRSLFQDSPELYEQPHMPWLFSELAIDPILTDQRLNRFILHEPTAKQPAYPEFYGINTPDGSLTDVIRSLYRQNSIEGFMRAGYEYCIKNRELFKPCFSS